MGLSFHLYPYVVHPSSEGSCDSDSHDPSLFDNATSTNISWPNCCVFFSWRPGLEVINLEFILRLKIKRNDWLFADTCPQAANHCALF